MSIMMVRVDGHFINVADISTVAPLTYTKESEPSGSKVTFMSKATYLTFPDLTPDQFMEELVSASVTLRLPD